MEQRTWRASQRRRYSVEDDDGDSKKGSDDGTEDLRRRRESTIAAAVGGVDSHDDDVHDGGHDEAGDVVLLDSREETRILESRESWEKRLRHTYSTMSDTGVVVEMMTKDC